MVRPDMSSIGYSSRSDVLSAERVPRTRTAVGHAGVRRATFRTMRGQTVAISDTSRVSPLGRSICL